MCSAAVLANVSSAIQAYLAPTPVNVTATLASQRRRLQQPSYSVQVEVSTLDSAWACMQQDMDRPSSADVKLPCHGLCMQSSTLQGCSDSSAQS